jgi:type II secretory pathway component GspD/PulD (secretin)
MKGFGLLWIGFCALTFALPLNAETTAQQGQTPAKVPAINFASPQIEIEVSVVKASRATMESLAQNAATPKSLSFLLSLRKQSNEQVELLGIYGHIPDEQVAEILSILGKTPGVEVETTPRVRCYSGQTGRVEVVSELRVPTSFDPVPGKADQLIASEFETRDVGLRMRVTPVLTPDNKSTDLKLKLSISTFEGFVRIKDGKQESVPLKQIDFSKQIPEKEGVLQPLFNDSQLDTKVIVPGGTNLVLGLHSVSEVKVNKDSKTSADPTRLQFVFIRVKRLPADALAK